MNVRTIQLCVINECGLMDEFRNSRYGSYGWFLRSKGIYVHSDSIEISENSSFKSFEDTLNSDIFKRTSDVVDILLHQLKRKFDLV